MDIFATSSTRKGASVADGPASAASAASAMSLAMATIQRQRGPIGSWELQRRPLVLYFLFAKKNSTVCHIWHWQFHDFFGLEKLHIQVENYILFTLLNTELYREKHLLTDSCICYLPLIDSLTSVIDSLIHLFIHNCVCHSFGSSVVRCFYHVTCLASQQTFLVQVYIMYLTTSNLHSSLLHRKSFPTDPWVPTATS